MAVEFYRKVEPSKNVVLSGIYRDLHMGQLQTANIGGGNREQAYLSRFILPSNPSYGNAVLDRFDYHIYVNSIDLAQNVYAFPEAVIYKTKDSKRISLTEGIQRINDSKTKDVLMFSSHLDGSASISEVFDGTKQAYGDAVTFVPVQRSIIRESQKYILPRHLKSQGREITLWTSFWNNDNTSESDIRAKYGVKASELGITAIDDSGARSANQKGLSTVVCPVEKADNMHNWGKRNLDWVVNPIPGESGAKKIYIHKNTAWRIKSGDRSTIPSTELYGDELTPENSIFEIVRGAEEFVGEVTKGEAAVELHAMGAARLSNAAYLTGAQSCELKTFWKKDTSKVNYPAIGTFTTAHYIDSGGSDNNGTRLGTPSTAGPDKRQEVMLCKKNILYPLKHPSKPYRRGAAQSATSQDVSEFANNIEMDIKIKSLAKAYAFGTDHAVTGGYYTLRRAFIVAFSEEPPEAGETFFEFAWKHRDINQGSLDLVRYGGSAGKKVKFMDANTLDYGRIETVTVHAAGTNYTANTAGTQAVTLDVTDAAGIPSSGSGQTFYTTVGTVGGEDEAILTATPKAAVYPAKETGYRVGDILSLTAGGGADAKLKVATITRYSRGFAATAFLNTDQGVLVADSSIVGGIGDSDPHGVIGAIGQQRTQWHLDETNKDVMISKSGFSVATEFGEGMLDQWLRLNFLVGAQSDRITPSSTVNPTAKAVATATVGSGEATMGLDGKEGTILVGDIMSWDDTGGVGMVRVDSINSQDSTTASIEVDKATAGWTNNDSIYFYTPKTGGFGESIYMVDGVAIGSYAGMEDGTWGRLLISQIGDGQLIQRTKGLSTSNDKSQFWSINSADGVAPYMNLNRWTRYMSIWLTNCPAEVDDATDEDNLLEENIDTMSSIFIDRIAFKDFNYNIENPNFNDRNLYPDSISIRPDSAMVGPDGAVDAADMRSDKITQYNSNAPTMLSIGVTDPTTLGYKATNEDALVDHYGWCSDRQGWLMLHNFNTENLANLAEIPDENMCATYTHASGLTAGKAKWGECYNTHYGMGGFMGEATNPALHHNGFEGWDDSPATNIGLKYLWTGLEAWSNVGGAMTALNLQPSENDTEGPMGMGHRMHWPIRPGDTIVFPSGDDSSNTTVETAIAENVVETIIGSTHSENFIITAAAAITKLDAGDNVFIHPEGMVDNFSKKGMMFFDINAEIQVATTDAEELSGIPARSGDFTTTSSVNWARRECGPASSRVLDVVDSTAYSVDFLVDTLKPLKLDVDEQYIIYVYGGDLDNTFFTTTDNISTTVDASATNAKSGIYIKSMDSSTNIITLEWDGKANDGTQMITEENLPALMISPYRHWIHLNIDCSSYASNVPTTTLPSRKYDSFSVMDNNFALWDGSSYHTGILDADITNIAISFDLDDASGIAVGDTIMIDDEAMYVRIVSSDTLTVIRGASGTYTAGAGTSTSGSPDYLTRTGVAHSEDAKVKIVTVHTAWGEHMSGNTTKSTKDGSLGGDGTAASGLAARRNLGSTYAEYLINHESSGGVNGAYINKWRPTVLEEGTIYETGTDFGFGSYDAAENTGGQLTNQILRAGEYNVFKMWDIKNAGDFVVDKQLDLLIKYKDDTVPHITNINTRFADTNKPFGLAVFKDTLPTKPTLSVKPHEEDPFLPEFIWEAADDDLWYGLLHIDVSSIPNQYHNKVAHIPLNEDIAIYGGIYLENSSGTKVAAAAGTFSNNYEGLAGYAKDFDEGSANYIKFASFTGDISSEMTVVVHIVPDNNTGTSYILNQSIAGQTYSDWEIYMNSSRQIVANLLPNGQTTNAITLTSSSISVDGETPTCVILTFDKNLKSGNAKLYINGQLDDQSGLILGTHTTNNWKNDTNLEDSSGPLFIGCDVAGDGSTLSNHFDGRIEEVVIYKKCLYPVVPTDGAFILSKPLKEISNSSPIAYTARLFIKDYHNIRGNTAIEVACSSPVSWRKAAFRLVD